MREGELPAARCRCYQTGGCLYEYRVMRVATAVFVVLLLLSPACALELCQQATGIADGYNSVFDVVVSVTPRQGEAIVIGVRPLGGSNLALNVSYVSDGSNYIFHADAAASTDAAAPGSGIVVLKQSIAAGTALSIKVTTATPSDEPTPFAFYSYVANNPICFLDISATSAFIGAVPTAESLGLPSGTNVDVYLRSSLPALAANTFDFTAQATSRQNPYSATTPRASAEVGTLAVARSFGVGITGTGTMENQGAFGGVVALPTFSLGGPFVYMRAKVAWTASATGPTFIKVACRWSWKFNEPTAAPVPTPAPQSWLNWGNSPATVATPAGPTAAVAESGSKAPMYFFIFVALLVGAFVIMRVRDPARTEHLLHQSKTFCSDLFGVTAGVFSSIGRKVSHSTHTSFDAENPRFPSHANGTYETVGGK